jgi:hypothetical protein
MLAPGSLCDEPASEANIEPGTAGTTQDDNDRRQRYAATIA